METTITAPAPYSSVKESVIFEIERNTDSMTEVMINGYLKQMPKNAFKVNVSHYFLEDFTIVPLDVEPGQILQMWDGIDLGRIVGASISVDGVLSEKVPLLYAEKKPQENRFMSDLRWRSIMQGQTDELPVYVSSPAILVCGDERLQIPAGMSFVALRVLPVFPERFEVILQAMDGRILDRIQYAIEQNKGVRLAWINAYGAIDYWNFTSRLKSSTKITKEKIYTENGYTTTTIRSDRTISAVSRPLPEDRISVLSRILTAEQAWCIKRADVCPIDITTESITTFDEEKLSAIKVEYRNRIR